MELSQKYLKQRRRHFLLGVVIAVCLVSVVLLSVSLGAMDIGIPDIAKIILGKGLSIPALLEGIPKNVAAVVWDIRLPRILCSVLVGAGLAVSGVIFQAILQNPLADPYTLGISTGAAFGASLAILLSVTYGFFVPVSLAALVCAFGTLAVVLLIARRGGGNAVSNLIISGIIVGSILSSAISFIKMLAGESVSAIVFWIMGSFSGTQWGDFALVAPVVAAAVALAALFSGDLNLMALGDKSAQALGVNTKCRRLLFLVLGACITAVCVSVCGVIGFVGLIVPHFLRFSVSSDSKTLLPLSALCGSILLCAADSATRVLSNGEIPVGVLTTLLGGPFFLYLFVKRRKGGGAA